MRVLILSFSSNQVNEDSYIPNKIGLTFSCVQDQKEIIDKAMNFGGN